MSDETFTFKIDDQEIEAKKGQTVLEAGLDNGIFVPHYCWHPGLSISGNCRMCLVHMKGGRKPIIACQTQASPGMEIEAYSEAAKRTREGVMEFLLINHPLDCPVCDQAGECDLQEYSYQHGRGESRFDENKNQKPNKDFGEYVRFNGNRCIVCTRCVRFCEEVTGTAELSIRERGDHNYIDIFPGYPLDNPLSLCTTDLCPVGALLDRDFIHKARVWNLTPTKTTCAGCASGCNTTVQSWNDEIQRVVPRENQCVNKWWMCDEGRMIYHESQREDRILECTELGQGGKREAIGFDRAVALLGENWRGAQQVHGEEGVGVICTGWHTNEELYTLLALLRGDKAPAMGGEDLPLATVFALPGFGWESQDGFKIYKDKNPNRSGVRLILGKTLAAGQGAGLERIEKAIDEQKLKLLVVLDGLLPGQLQLPESFLEKARTVPYVVSFESKPGSKLSEFAHLQFPAASTFEKDGSFVNVDDRVQRVRPAVPAKGQLRWEIDVLQEVARRAGVVPHSVSSASLFKRLAKAPGSPFKGLSYNDLGEYGVSLKGEDSVKPSSGYDAGPVSRGRYMDTSVAEMIRVSVHRGG